MSDTVRDAPIGYLVALPGKPFAITVPVEKMDLLEGHHNAPLYLAATPAPPAPQSVQDIMPLLNAYVWACVNFEQAKLPGIEAFQSAEYAKLCATSLPLQAALTALVDDNHRLQFELDGVNAMRRPLSDEIVDSITEQQWGRPSADVMFLAHRSYARAIEKAHGIAPEQGEVK